MSDSPPLVTSRQSDTYWRATFDNPPRNLIDFRTAAALLELMDTLEADPTVKVVVFDSADETSFISISTPPAARIHTYPPEPAPPACPAGPTWPPG